MPPSFVWASRQTTPCAQPRLLLCSDVASENPRSLLAHLSEHLLPGG